MPLMIQDTRTRSKREFVPRNPPEVSMYVCGPTVYGPAHLGHARSYVAFDVVRRYLDFKGFRVRLVQNFTDVDDAVTRAAKEQGVSTDELSSRNIRSFLNDMDALGVKRAAVYPRVGEHIKEIISTVQALIEKGYAYTLDGNVFFRVSKAKSLGKLSHRDVEAMIVDQMASPEGRENPLDFVLWRKSQAGHPAWPSPWGDGRPGWHVECFAMSSKYLGDHLDIHCGGTDLIFPHHESEAMVSEAFVGGDWCNFWLHNGFITIEQQKMSKSLGNFVMVADLLKEYPGEVVRFCMMKEQYRKNVEYDRDCFKRTQEEMERMKNAMERARTAGGKPGGSRVAAVVKSTRERFIKAMDNDFDTATAIDVLIQFTEAVQEIDEMSAEEGRAITATYGDICEVLGLNVTP